MSYFKLASTFIFLTLWLAGVLPAQSIAELEARLSSASSADEQCELHFKLAKNWLADDLSKAEFHAQRAAELATKVQNKAREAEAALVGAEIAQRAGRKRDAIARYTQARAAAVAAMLPELNLQAVQGLQDFSVLQGDYRAAYEWSGERSALLQAKSRLYADEQRKKHETAQSELANQKNREMSIWLAALAGLLLSLSIFYYMRQRSNRRVRGELAEKNAMIEEKRRRSEQLLLNILPRAVAAELTVRNKVAARRYECATVMFVDFVGFTRAAEQLQPEELVQELDHCFSRFDSIIGRFRIEKIKTVGDAYICASGLSDRNEQPADMIRAALEMQVFLQKLKAERSAAGRPQFEARIGIHFGPVVAGVVGAKKFAYDIWGDTVNTAARMEEACEPGRVNVSGTAQVMAQGEFRWDYRGKISAKNKAEMEMYYAGTRNEEV